MALLALDRAPLTFAALERLTLGGAAVLQSAGVRREDRVVAVLPNGPEMATAFLTMATAATAAPLNPAYRAEEFAFYLDDLRPRCVIVSSDLESPVREIARERGIAVLDLARGGAAGTFSLHGTDGTTLGPSTTNSAGSMTDVAGADDVALVLHTSGTTSRPKQVPLSHANLCASARHIAATLRLQPSDRCLNVMPLFHIHGIMAAVLSSLGAGASVVCTPGLSVPDVLHWMASTRATWYTAVPTMHQAVLDAAVAAGGVPHPLRFIRSSSAALPRQVRTGLEDVLAAPVVEAYGMTEAAHQMASNGLTPATRRGGSVGRAAGPEIAIMDGCGEVLPAGTTGEIVIRGPNVTGGYAGNPAANATAFHGGWFRTGDQGYLDVDGFLFLTGRLKELINRGGEKIAPAEIDELLLDHPAVAQATTFAMPHATLGEDVAAAVVLRNGVAATERQLRDFVAARVAYHKVPRRIVILDAIPRGPTGKPQRIGLAERLGIHAMPSPSASEAPVRPPTPVEEVVAAIVGDILDCDPPGVHEDFFDLGGNSIHATQVVAWIHELLGVQLSLLEFFDTPTVAALAERVTAEL